MGVVPANSPCNKSQGLVPSCVPTFSWSKRILSALKIFLSNTAFLGNVLILVALHKVNSIYPPTKFFFWYLAVTDLCVGLMHQSLNSSGAHPPPGNRGAFAYFVSPGGWALAYPGATPGNLTHVFSKDGWIYREGRDLCQRPPCPSGTRKTCRCF